MHLNVGGTMSRPIVIVTLLAVLSLSRPHATEQYVSPNAPVDRPEQASGSDQIAAMEAALRPYVDQARKTYPDARARFIKGLPPKHGFFVVTRLPVGDKGYEQIFVAVDRI